MIGEFSLDWARGNRLPIVLVDVDGVLFDHRHRLHLITKPNSTPEDRREYNNLAALDTPLPFLRVVDMLWYSPVQIVFLSARPNTPDQRRIFQSCLSSSLADEALQSGRMATHFKDVSIYGHGASASTKFKQEFVEMLRADNLDILFAVDYSDHQIEMYRRLGVCALQYG